MKSTRFYGKSKTPATLSRLLDLVEENARPYRNEDGQFSVTILPPTNATSYITDEDSGDEDGAVTVNNLPRSMLLAPAILDESSNPNDETVEEPPKKKRRKQTDTPSRSWAKTDLKSDLPELVPDDTIIEDLQAKRLTPIGYFELFFDDEIFNLIVEETNRYASEKNRSLIVDKNDIKCFIEILVLSGYLAPARRRLFWENATDTHHALVANAMRRDKFGAIFANFHLANNNNCLDDKDKFAQVRPLIKLLNKKFQQYAPNEEFYSFDESICEYYGRHRCKQFLRGKPIRFGFKIWCGTTPLGYLVWFDPYQGKVDSSRTQENNLGLGGNLVTKFAYVLASLGRKFFTYATITSSIA